jgi:murein DD-endopeptidase MepM/ murein hydrolase activator NlpD
MARRLNTIIIVPHNKTKFTKLTFTTRTFVLAVSGATLAVVLAVFALAYTGNAVHRRAELERLQKENAELRSVNQQLEGAVAAVQGQLDEFEARTSRLALAAGLENTLAPVFEGELRTEAAGSGGPYDRLSFGPAEMDHVGGRIDSLLGEIESELGERRRTLSCTPSIAPVHGVYTDGFGRRKDPFTGRWAWHRGLDISARKGTQVRAPADGVVVFSGWDSGYGRVLRISHGFGYTTVFAHLNAATVEPGDEVRRGQVIAEVGNTGRSTGPHLHYEVHADGKTVNPLYYILDAH